MKCISKRCIVTILGVVFLCFLSGCRRTIEGPVLPWFPDKAEILGKPIHYIITKEVAYQLWFSDHTGFVGMQKPSGELGLYCDFQLESGVYRARGRLGVNESY